MLLLLSLSSFTVFSSACCILMLLLWGSWRTESWDLSKNLNRTGSRLFCSGSTTPLEWPPRKWTARWGTPVPALPLPPPGSMVFSCHLLPTSTVWRPSCGTAMSYRWTMTSLLCSTESSLSQSSFSTTTLHTVLHLITVVTDSCPCDFPCRLLYNWSMSLPCNIVLKKAVDSLLCSICHIHPSYFSLLMSWMGIVSGPSASHSQAQQRRLAMTDDGKKQHDACASAAGLTDDSKHARAPVTLSESQLTTLAAASQSPGAIEQLLDSGLPSLLVRSLTQFCVGLLVSADLPLPVAQADRRHHHHHYYSSSHNRPPLAAELAAPVLRFLTEVGNSHVMKDWLGGPEVNPLWTALLFLLCHSSASASAGTTAATGASAVSQPVNTGPAVSPTPPQPQHSGSRFSLASSVQAGGLTTQQRTALENATVAFFLQCISCHPNNQRLMAQVCRNYSTLLWFEMTDLHM